MRIRILTTIVLAAAAGAGTFFATLVSGQGGHELEDSRQPLGRWLDLSAQQAADVAAADPTFDGESDDLAAELHTQREQLAKLLEDPTSTDEAIMAQVEKTINAHDALERRVAKHVLAIREKLTPEQQKRLMGLAASGVREAGRYGYRGGQGGGERGGAGDDSSEEPGRHRGGRGRGGGRGQGPPS